MKIAISSILLLAGLAIAEQPMDPFLLHWLRMHHNKLEHQTAAKQNVALPETTVAPESSAAPAVAVAAPVPAVLPTAAPAAVSAPTVSPMAAPEQATFASRLPSRFPFVYAVPSGFGPETVQVFGSPFEEECPCRMVFCFAPPCPCICMAAELPRGIPILPFNPFPNFVPREPTAAIEVLEDLPTVLPEPQELMFASMPMAINEAPKMEVPAPKMEVPAATDDRVEAPCPCNNDRPAIKLDRRVKVPCPCAAGRFLTEDDRLAVRSEPQVFYGPGSFLSRYIYAFPSQFGPDTVQVVGRPFEQLCPCQTVLCFRAPCPCICKAEDLPQWIKIRPSAGRSLDGYGYYEHFEEA